MSNSSRWTHLIRLGAILAFGTVGFFVVKAIATPSSWDYENWYRRDSLKEIAALPQIYGGNDSCRTCHADEHEELIAFGHKKLSCESCHGALADHVRDGKKIANAAVDNESTWQCLNCHATLITRRAVGGPKGFPQFSTDRIEEHKEVAKGMLCVACHNPHDPAP